MNPLLPISTGILMALSSWLCSAEPPRGEMYGYLLFDGERCPRSTMPASRFTPRHGRWSTTIPDTSSRPGCSAPGCTLSIRPARSPRRNVTPTSKARTRWWRDTHFPTTTPKFIMGGVGRLLGHRQWPRLRRGQLGRRARPLRRGPTQSLVLFPLDGLNLKQGVQGELFGYGYLPLPLTDPKPTPRAPMFQPGNQCWTLFLNTANFKGPPRSSCLLLVPRPAQRPGVGGQTARLGSV